MPGVAGAAVAVCWSLIVVVSRRPWRTTCACVRAVAAAVPGGRWVLLAVCCWLPAHLCRPLFRRSPT